MPFMKRIAMLSAPFLLVAGLTGCVKLKQAITLMPGGAGKIHMQFAVSDAIAKQVKAEGDDPFKEVQPETMKRKCKGIVAFTTPERWEKDGFVYLTYTAYFRDINKLQITGLGETKPATYRYRRDGDAAKLAVTHGVVLSIVDQYEGTPKDEREELREVFAGVEIGEHFVLPGAAKPVQGVAIKDNTAKVDVTLDHYLEGTGPIKALKGVETIELVIPKITLDVQTEKAFLAELEKAVKAWRETQKKN